MMRFEWIVPVVVLVVWLVTTIVRNREEEEPVKRKPGQEPQRGPLGDIDRFLQEIEKLRKDSGAPKPTAPPVVVETTPAPRPKPKPLVKPEVRPSVLPKAKARIAKAEIPAVTSVPEVMPVMAVTPSMEHIPVMAAALPGRRQARVAPVIASMLRSPNSIAAAIALREILDEPRCKRPRR